MKAEMDKDGTLIVSPENGVEAVALQAWSENYCQFVSAIAVQTPRPEGGYKISQAWAKLLVGGLVEKRT